MIEDSPSRFQSPCKGWGPQERRGHLSRGRGGTASLTFQPVWKGQLWGETVETCKVAGWAAQERGPVRTTDEGSQLPPGQAG